MTEKYPLPLAMCPTCQQGPKLSGKGIFGTGITKMHQNVSVPCSHWDTAVPKWPFLTGLNFLQIFFRRPPQLSFVPIIFLYSSTPETTMPSRLARSLKGINFRKMAKKKKKPSEAILFWNSFLNVFGRFRSIQKVVFSYTFFQLGTNKHAPPRKVRALQIMAPRFHPFRRRFATEQQNRTTYHTRTRTR